MKVDTLDELKSAFSQWRRNKRYLREPLPEELLNRARRATEKHGVEAVIGVTGVRRTRLFRNSPTSMKPQESSRTTLEDVSIPTFSRLELIAPCVPRQRTCPIAEVETGMGVTLRVFEQTPEMLGLLTAVCGQGGVR